MARDFGHISGQPVGSVYANRAALAAAGIHRPHQHGISGAGAEGADSIVVSGGYEDDRDYGDRIIYTGAGGRDPAIGKQIADQHFTGQNLALLRSSVEGYPVRVTRGSSGDPAFSPKSGYKYDGLFRVEEAWREKGQSGFYVCRYRLIRLEPDGTPVAVDEDDLPVGPTPRAKTQVQRLVRNTALARKVKEIHKDTCQACGVRLLVATGAYSEGAHIRPLGRPHDGPDVISNILCLCPNCHVRFEYGALAIEDDLTVIDRINGSVVGKLRASAAHVLDLVQIAYHREHFDLGEALSGTP